MIKSTIVSLFWVFIATIVFFSSFKEQVVVSDSIKKEINIAFPEGWGFFTKNPRDLHLEVYKIGSQGIKHISMYNNSLNNYLGLSRKSRVIGYEASMVANKVKKEFWKKNKGKNIDNFINDSIIEIYSISDFKYMGIGDYLIKLYKPVPYAWSKENQESNNPFKIVRIRVIPRPKDDK